MRLRPRRTHPRTQPPLERSAAPKPRETIGTSARLVLWSGGMDPIDPPAWAERVATHWGGELATVEQSDYSVIRYLETPNGNCGHANLQALLADPAAPLARRCLTAIEGVGWSQTQPATHELVASWLGT